MFSYMSAGARLTTRSARRARTGTALPSLSLPTAGSSTPRFSQTFSATKEIPRCKQACKPRIPPGDGTLTRISHRVWRRCSENPVDIRSPADEPSARADSTMRPARRFWPEARVMARAGGAPPITKRVAGSVSVDTLRKTSAEGDSASWRALLVSPPAKSDRRTANAVRNAG